MAYAETKAPQQPIERLSDALRQMSELEVFAETVADKLVGPKLSVASSSKMLGTAISSDLGAFQVVVETGVIGRMDDLARLLSDRIARVRDALLRVDNRL